MAGRNYYSINKMKNNLKIISSLIIIIGLILSLAFSFGNKTKSEVKIQLTNMKVVFLHIENPVTISVPGVEQKELAIAVMHGTIRKDSTKPNLYWIHPEMGYNKFFINVNIKTEKELKTIATDSFRIKYPDRPIFYFGNHSLDGVMSHDEIRKELGVFSRMNDWDFNGTYRITTFSMSLFTNGDWKESTTDGPAFTKKQLEDLNALQSGDRILFHNIIVKAFGGIDSATTCQIPGMFIIVK